MTLKMLSLFSGIGGLDLAAHWAGIETVAFCEIEPFCQKVLAKHWPGVPIFDDVRTVTAESLRERGITGVDIIAGGFPCQDISVAGRGEGLEGERSGLWFQMYRIIEEVRPRFVVAENVPALRTRGADAVLSRLEKAGYSCGAFVVGAWAVGAPHRRERVWIVAKLDGADRSLGQPEGIAQPAQEQAGEVASLFRPFPARASFPLFGMGDSESAGRWLDDRSVGDTHGEACNGRRAVSLAPDSDSGMADAAGDAGECQQGQRESLRNESTVNGSEGAAWRWPARPGEPQHEWEQPRVVLAHGGNRSRRQHEPERRPEGREAVRRAGKRGREPGQPESRMGDAVNGLPGRVARHRTAKLKALGNAVVPQVAYPIFEAIVAHEAQEPCAGRGDTAEA